MRQQQEQDGCGRRRKGKKQHVIFFGDGGGDSTMLVKITYRKKSTAVGAEICARKCIFLSLTR